MDPNLFEPFPGYREMAKPLFTPEAYEAFRQRFREEMEPVMEELNRRRRESERASMFHIVD